MTDAEKLLDAVRVMLQPTIDAMTADCMFYGKTHYRTKPDGTIEHVPIDEIVINETDTQR